MCKGNFLNKASVFTEHVVCRATLNMFPRATSFDLSKSVLKAQETRASPTSINRDGNICVVTSSESELISHDTRFLTQIHLFSLQDILPHPADFPKNFFNIAGTKKLVFSQLFVPSMTVPSYHPLSTSSYKLENIHSHPPPKTLHLSSCHEATPSSDPLLPSLLFIDYPVCTTIKLWWFVPNSLPLS